LSQETEEGVTDANVGIAASLYISISNIGAAVLPVDVRVPVMDMSLGKGGISTSTVSGPTPAALAIDIAIVLLFSRVTPVGKADAFT
jgi:hypothetical protein